MIPVLVAVVMFGGIFTVISAIVGPERLTFALMVTTVAASLGLVALSVWSLL